MLSKRQDFWLVLIWPLFAAFLCLSFPINFAASTIVFYVIPSVYLSIKMSGQIVKTSVMSFTGALIWSTFDYIWELTNAWNLTSIANYKFLDVISIEAPIWSFFWFYFLIICYEYFYEKDGSKEKTQPLTYKLLVAGLFGFLLLSFLVVFLNADLRVPYSYLVLGSIVCIVPIILMTKKYPALRKKFFYAGLYFFYATIVYEMIGLYNHYWYFPDVGQFIGKTHLLGFPLPFEEIVLWITLGSIGVLSWYEFFDDDRK